MDLSTLDVQSRLTAELLELARAGRNEGNVATIDPAPRHADLASRISTYREQVTRELSALARVGILERSGRALIVRDVARLARLVAAARGSARETKRRTAANAYRSERLGSQHAKRLRRPPNRA